MNNGKRLIMVDEAWELLNRSEWNPKTPLLLNAGAPAFESAVLPDRRVFSWHRLEHLIARLPADCFDDLRSDSLYSSLGTNEQLETAFIRNELIPLSVLPLVDYIKKGYLFPEGFRIKFLFTEDGTCIGRVLVNIDIGGIIPAIYPIEGDDVYRAVAKLICGEIVPAELGHTNNVEIAPIYDLGCNYSSMGHDLAKDLAQHAIVARPRLRKKVTDKAHPSCLHTLPISIQSAASDTQPVLVGATFIERGQIYLRVQLWFGASDTPAALQSDSLQELALAIDPTSRYPDSQDVIPAAALAYYQAAKSDYLAHSRRAAKHLASDQGIANSLAVILALVTPDVFDAYCDRLFDIELPLPTPEEDELYQDEILQLRESEMARLITLGEGIKLRIPALTPFKASSLALMLQFVNGEAPGSDDAFRVMPPEADSIPQFLNGMILHASACKALIDLSNELYSANREVANAVYMAQSGAIAPEAIARIAPEFSRFWQKLTSQDNMLSTINQWRNNWDAMAELRSKGEFLYVRNAIDPAKPSSMLDDYWRTARKYSAKMVTVTSPTP